MPIFHQWQRPFRQRFSGWTRRFTERLHLDSGKLPRCYSPGSQNPPGRKPPGGFMDHLRARRKSLPQLVRSTNAPTPTPMLAGEFTAYYRCGNGTGSDKDVKTRPPERKLKPSEVKRFLFRNTDSAPYLFRWSRTPSEIPDFTWVMVMFFSCKNSRNCSMTYREVGWTISWSNSVC